MKNSEKFTVLVRCDASPSIGYGHLMRCVALAEQMRACGQWDVIFAMTDDRAGIDLVRERGFTVEHPQFQGKEHAERDWLALLADRHQADLLLLDLRNDLRRADVEAVRGNDITIVCIDDLSERRLAADLVFFPPVPQVRHLDWTGFRGRWFSGWEWIMMPTHFAAERASLQPVYREIPQLLITMGGSDPAGMTLRAIDALDTLDSKFETNIVVGSAFMHGPALKRKLEHTNREYRVTVNPPSIARVMKSADLALASFGATAYELACLGIPTLHLCLSEDHAKSASALTEAGAAVSLGIYSEVSLTAIRAAISQLLDDSAQRAHMRDAALSLVDGRGTSRVIEKLHQSIEAKYAIRY
jgi:spore coat polysaccharide biosynthesis predicted glycosyltransferase SpsG